MEGRLRQLPALYSTASKSDNTPPDDQLAVFVRSDMIRHGHIIPNHVLCVF